MCQQAIEKLVKGLYILYKNEEPPRTHNIWNIFDMTFDIDELMDFQFIDIEKYFSFFDELLAYYIWKISFL